MKWVVPAAAVLVEFRKFPAKIDSQVPEGLDVHPICDNYQTLYRHLPPREPTDVTARTIHGSGSDSASRFGGLERKS